MKFDHKEIKKVKIEIKIKFKKNQNIILLLTAHESFLCW